MVSVILLKISSMFSPVIAELSTNKHSKNLDHSFGSSFILTVFLSELRSLSHFHCSMFFFVLFVAYYHECRFPSRELSGLTQPTLNMLEWFLGSDVIDYDDAKWAPEVAPSHGFVPFLPCGIPNLNLNHFPVDFHKLHPEFYSHCMSGILVNYKSLNIH